MTITLSASQVSTWELCQRKWGWRYIEGIKDEPTRAQALGTAVDEGQLQPYLTQGRPIEIDTEAGAIAQLAIPYIPPPQTPGVSVQHKFVIPSSKGDWEYLGYQDIWIPDISLLPNWTGSEKGPCVVDFKTTRDLKWQKKAKDLLADAQAVLYSVYAFGAANSDAVNLRWIYMRTSRPGVATTDVTVTRGDIEVRWQSLEASAAAITAARTFTTKVLDLAPNPDACEAFGGCPHRARCNLSPTERLVHLTRKTVGGSMAATSFDILAGLAKKADVVLQQAPVAPAVVLSDRDVSAPTELPAWLQSSAGVNPPESKEKQLTLFDQPVVVETSAPPPQPPVEEAPKKGRGRPKKTEEPPQPPQPVEPLLNQSGASESFSVTWGAETVNQITVGPFEATGAVRPGETLVDAMQRVYRQLEVFALMARADKQASYQRAAGGGK